MLFAGLVVILAIEAFKVLGSARGAFAGAFRKALLFRMIRRFGRASFFGFCGMMLFAADYLGGAMRRLAGELHQLFGFAAELGGLLRKLGAESGRSLRVLRLEFRNFGERFLARGLAFLGIAQRGF